MKRRTLDIIVSTGGLLLAGILVIAGLVLTSNASFSKDYVRDQLSREKIEFPPVEGISPEDRAFTEARTGCLITYAGQPLTTGKQAECWGNEYIGSHLTYLATRLGMPQIAYADGLTYLELGLVQRDLGERIAAAQESGDPAVADLEQELADITTLRTKVFEGTMLRNALLTSYGFSVLGEKAGQAATVAFAVATVLALLAIAGFGHAFITPRTKAFAPVEQPDVEALPREPAGV